MNCPAGKFSRHFFLVLFSITNFTHKIEPPSISLFTHQKLRMENVIELRTKMKGRRKKLIFSEENVFNEFQLSRDFWVSLLALSNLMTESTAEMLDKAVFSSWSNEFCVSYPSSVQLFQLKLRIRTNDVDTIHKLNIKNNKCL